jgi:hypothetical protein
VPGPVKIDSDPTCVKEGVARVGRLTLVARSNRVDGPSIRWIPYFRMGILLYRDVPEDFMFEDVRGMG